MEAQATESNKRKQELIGKLRNLGVYQLADGRKVDRNLSLYTLEWSNITAQNEVAREYGNIVRDSGQSN